MDSRGGLLILALVTGCGGETRNEDPDACTRVVSDTDERTLSSAEDVEALRGVHTLEGSLSITGEVTDLSPLSCLRQIKGDLGVHEAPALPNLDGLENLETIDGSLTIGGVCKHSYDECKGTAALTTLAALANLKSVTAIIIVPMCFGEGREQCVAGPPLEEVHFDALTELDELRLSSLPAATEVRFDALRSADDMVLFGADDLGSVHFPSLEELRALSLGGLPRLTSLEGFSSLKQLGSLYVGRMNLTTLQGLQLEELASLMVANNEDLISLEGLERLETLDSVRIMSNQSLENFRGLDSLEAISSDLEATANPSLTSLDGFESLTRVNRFFVQSNYALTDISALYSLERVETSLRFWTNTLLPHCEVERLGEAIGEENIALLDVSGGDETATCD